MSKPNEPQQSPRFPDTSALAPLTRKRAQELVGRDPFGFTGHERLLSIVAALALLLALFASLAGGGAAPAATVAWNVFWVAIIVLILLRGVSAQREQLFWWKRAHERLAESDDETDGETP